MLVQNPKEVADKLESISKDVVRSGAMPIITKNGILIGTYIIQPKDGKYHVKHSAQLLYSTYSKSAAMIVARMLTKKIGGDQIREVIESDRIAFSARQDLEVYKRQIKVAEKNNNYLKEELYTTRFEVTDQKYQQAKATLQKSYSLLF
jgi:hypothetical protein